MSELSRLTKSEAMGGEILMGSDVSLFDVVIEGEEYREGSSHPWRGGTYTAVVEAGSRAEAVIEVFEGLGANGRIVSEGGDADWMVFDSERELTIRVSPVPDATRGE